MRNPRPLARWELTPESLPRIDAHFWDWVLWLGAKQLRGQTDLVGAELTKMWNAVLEPLGVFDPPASIAAAIAAYTVARDNGERELGVHVARELERQVRNALSEHDLVAADLSS